MHRSPVMTMMIRAAEKAGRAILRDFGEVEHLQASRKGPRDFVTVADERPNASCARNCSAPGRGSAC